MNADFFTDRSTHPARRGARRPAPAVRGRAPRVAGAGHTVMAAAVSGLLALSSTLLLGVAPPSTAAPSSPCLPSAEHPYPVVLLHGTMDDAGVWNVLEPRLIAAGYCAFAPTYGASASPVPLGGGTSPVESSAAEVAAYIAGVLARTGADQVDIVGHSQGGVIAEYYAKNMGKADRVHAEVLLAPTTHGTTMQGLVDVANQAPAVREAVDTAVLPLFCAACADQEVGSSFIDDLNAGPIAQPGVRYAVMATRDDTTNTPAGASSFIDEPGVRNIFVQDLRPGIVTHQELPRDPVAVEWVLNQLAAP